MPRHLYCEVEAPVLLPVLMHLMLCLLLLSCGCLTCVTTCLGSCLATARTKHDAPQATMAEEQKAQHQMAVAWIAARNKSKTQ